MRVGYKGLCYYITVATFLSLSILSCEGGSNQYSSAEKTWCRLIKAAKENDMEEYEKCMDFVSWVQSYGYTTEEIESFERLKEMMNESQYADFIKAEKRAMQFMTEHTWVVISEKEEGLSTRILEVAANGDVSSTMKWYFSKRDKGWFLNFPLTDMNFIKEHIEGWKDLIESSLLEHFGFFVDVEILKEDSEYIIEIASSTKISREYLFKSLCCLTVARLTTKSVSSSVRGLVIKFNGQKWWLPRNHFGENADNMITKLKELR
ncbi:hypothetical protein KAX97_05180 [candidate division WOR-3 bacterium]|nr:hypothetical protein [candidate division WOR-3 bacterium]